MVSAERLTGRAVGGFVHRYLPISVVATIAEIPMWLIANGLSDPFREVGNNKRAVPQESNKRTHLPGRAVGGFENRNLPISALVPIAAKCPKIMIQSCFIGCA